MREHQEVAKSMVESCDMAARSLTGEELSQNDFIEGWIALHCELVREALALCIRQARERRYGQAN